MTTAVPAQRSTGGGGGSSGLYDVLELILDRGLVIDAFVRVSLVGIEILKIDVRVVVASVDTYLRFAEACNRLDLESGPRKSPGLPEVLENATESGANSKTKGALAGAAETLSDAFRQGRSSDEEEEAEPRRRRAAGRRKEESE
ncbi:gas vesicle structural protein GvpA [Streptomyces megasporus]|uniref:gas vesicle structural protein GvpA n=1 Tax=Streptomyces megasporus TaxID=44060 RepID=UPI0004E0C435|nr:gas vesicle structural protein GvpA [Streptomyces megasporus]